MSLFSTMHAELLTALESLIEKGRLPLETDLSKITVEAPHNPEYGDLATNAAMILARTARRAPRDLALEIAEELRKNPDIADISIDGPGFINLRLAPAMIDRFVREALEQTTDFGRSEIGRGTRVNLEYVSANPTGPMHVGHMRGAVFGDALARLLAFTGHDVTREYYINDAGAQVEVLARSAYERYREAYGHTPNLTEGLYPGSYLQAVGQELKTRFGTSLFDMSEAARLDLCRDTAIEMMMGVILDDLALLGVHMDVFFSEKSLEGSGRTEAALQRLAEQGLIYQGRLDPPKGLPQQDWEDREQTLFRSTICGDDIDRPVRKSDGSWTYFAPDIAYHWTKIERGFTRIIDVFGADHAGYVKRMTAAVAALSAKQIALEVKLIQMVRLCRGGEEIKMSKRAGTYVTLREVIEQVGKDAARFHMLHRKADVALDFDFEAVVAQSKDNPVYYVQYAHARAASALRKAAMEGREIGTKELAKANLELCRHPVELGLKRKLIEWPRIVEQAACRTEPHRIPFYLHEVASAFHALWTLGTETPELRLLQEDPEICQARLALAKATAIVLFNGLDLMGVTPAETMSNEG